MRFDQKCIKCETSSNLNTIISIKVNNVEYHIAICDEHSEDLTPKQIRIMVEEKLSTLQMLINQIKEYGIDLSDKLSGDGLVVVEKEKKVEEVEEESPSEIKKEKVVVNKKVLKKHIVEKVRSIGGSIDGATLESRETINPSNEIQKVISDMGEKGEKVGVIPVTEEIEYQMVKGRDNIPMRIAKKIKHNIGSTKIIVVDTGGDRTIQNRFKSISEKSKSGTNPHLFGGAEYNTVRCTLCDGTGIAKIGDGACQKCGGIGFFNR